MKGLVKKMKIGLLILLSGVVLVLLGVVLTRIPGLSFINLPGLILVVGGTLVASVIGHGPRPVLDLLRRIPSLFRSGDDGEFVDHQALLQIATLYRRGSVRGAEQTVEALQDPFLKNGARLALDPNSGEELTRMLEWRVRRQKEQDAAEVRIFRTMATFAPAFGLLGTLFGLISLLGQLGASALHDIGLSMGFGLMSTLYGLVTANLVFRPLALKLEDHSRRRLSWLGFLSEALIMLHQRQHPTLIAEYLATGAELPAAPNPPAALRLVLDKAA